MEFANTPAYYKTATITAINIFIVPAPRPNAIKVIAAVN
jgi:hypothetical protein